jgi:hypothetical protein
MGPVVDDHVEAARRGDDQLLELAVRVAAARLAAGDVVEVVDPVEAERDLGAGLDERQVPARVRDSRELHDPTPRDALAEVRPDVGGPAPVRRVQAALARRDEVGLDGPVHAGLIGNPSTPLECR